MFNHVTAKNEIRKLFFDRFKDFVLNGIPNQDSVFPPLNLGRLQSNEAYVPKVFWRNVEKEATNDNGAHFLHFAMQNVRSNQKSFTGGRQNNVGTLHTTYGFVTVEIYFSKTAYQTIDEDRLSTIVQRCFIQQNVEGIWFRNALIVDLPAEENHFRTNVLAEYEYDSIIT